MIKKLHRDIPKCIIYIGIIGLNQTFLFTTIHTGKKNIKKVQILTSKIYPRIYSTTNLRIYYSNYIQFCSLALFDDLWCKFLNYDQKTSSRHTKMHYIYIGIIGLKHTFLFTTIHTRKKTPKITPNFNINNIPQNFDHK